MTTNKKHGFTLIELSIVLVIIGLLVGGVLVGRDLIKAAEIRSQVSQIEKYNIAVKTFKLKYDEIPGDMLGSKATAFGLFSSSAAPAVGNGDGNSSITSNNASGAPYGRGEPVIFWRHLTESKMIEGSYSATTGAAAGNIDIGGFVAVLPTTHYMITAHFPEGKIGKGTTVTVGSYNNTLGSYGAENWFSLAGVNAMSSTLGYFTGSNNVLTPQEASSIDIKIDDGKPNTGSVRAVDSAWGQLPWAGYFATPLSTCVTSGDYVVSSAVQSCSLQFKFR